MLCFFLFFAPLLHAEAWWCPKQDIEFCSSCIERVELARKCPKFKDCSKAYNMAFDTSDITWCLDLGECKRNDKTYRGSTYRTLCSSNEVKVGRFFASIKVIKINNFPLKAGYIAWRIGNDQYKDPRAGHGFNDLLKIVVNCKKGKSEIHFDKPCDW